MGYMGKKITFNQLRKKAKGHKYCAPFDDQFVQIILTKKEINRHPELLQQLNVKKSNENSI